MICAAVISAGALGSCGMSEYDGDLRGRYDYNLKEYLKAGKYKELKVYVGSEEPSEQEIADKIYRNRGYYPEDSWKSVGEGVPAERGNIADVIYQGYIDGKPLSDMVSYKKEGYSMMLGANMLLDGVDDQIIGMKIGDKKTFEITVPDPCFDYPYYVGETVTMEVEVTGIRSATLMEYNDEFAANYGVSTIEDFEAQIISELKRSRESKLESYVIARAMKSISESFEAKKYPDKEYSEVYEALAENGKNEAADEGMTLEEYVASYDMTMEEYETNLEESARQIVFEEMVLYYIARNEKIALTNAAFDEKAEELAEENGLSSPEQYVSFMASYGYTEYDVREEIWFDLVMDFIYENTVQVNEK